MDPASNRSGPPVPSARTELDCNPKHAPNFSSRLVAPVLSTSRLGLQPIPGALKTRHHSRLTSHISWTKEHLPPIPPRPHICYILEDTPPFPFDLRPVGAEQYRRYRVEPIHDPKIQDRPPSDPHGDRQSLPPPLIHIRSSQPHTATTHSSITTTTPVSISIQTIQAMVGGVVYLQPA